MLDGIKNFLQFVNDNWTTIIIIISLGIALYQRIRTYVSKSNTEKIDVAKKQIKEIILKLISDAEEDYYYMTSAGSIKRSQVIKKIFEDYPVLSKVTDQETLIKWIDEIIDESLTTLREIVAVNEEKASEATNDESKE